MHPVFQRYTLNLDPALDELLDRPDTELGFRQRAVARNVMHDHRVSPEREEIFRQCTAAEPKLTNALRRYYDKHVRAGNDAHFVDGKYNQENLVAGARTEIDVMDPNTPLVRVVNLNREREAFQWGAREWADPRMDQFVDIAEAGSDRELHDAIGARIQEDIETFLGTWLDMRKARRSALRATGTTKSDGPVWVTFAEVFEGDVDPSRDGPDRWFEVVGVHLDGAPVWAILLRYTLREAGTVARPTILDAGGYPYHFPSPPGLEPSLGGFMMDLRIDPACEHLRNEFIHETIDFKFDDWVAAGRRYGETTRPGPDGIDRQRMAHHQLLDRSYDGVMSWMPKCV